MRKSLIIAALLAATATPALAQLVDVAVVEGAGNSEMLPHRGDRATVRVEAPVMAQSQDANPDGRRGRGGGGGNGAWQRHPEAAQDRGERSGGWQGRQQQQQAAPAPTYTPPAPQAAAPVQQERRWNGERAAGGGWQGGGWQGRGDGQRGPRANAQAQSQAPVFVDRQARPQPNAQWNGQAGARWSGNRDTFQNRTNAPTYVERNGGRVEGQRDWRNDARRDDRRWDGNSNAQRYGNDRNRQYNQQWGNNDRSWNRDWRRDQRFDWQRYRYSNRDLFRSQHYYAPYGWNYGYRRFSIGFSLSNILFSQQYWIEDPYAYRLPPAYGQYRWVRYYDDVLLVDLRSGEVVDAIYDFFD